MDTQDITWFKQELNFTYKTLYRRIKNERLFLLILHVICIICGTFLTIRNFMLAENEIASGYLFCSIIWVCIAIFRYKHNTRTLNEIQSKITTLAED